MILESWKIFILYSFQFMQMLLFIHSNTVNTVFTLYVPFSGYIHALCFEQVCLEVVSY